MSEINIKYFFCESFRFDKGAWYGVFRFSVSAEDAIHNGMLSILYRKGKQAQRLSKRIVYPKSLAPVDNLTKIAIREKVEDAFHTFFAQAKSLLIDPRETFMPPPALSRFRFHADESGDDYWLFTFYVHHPFHLTGTKKDAFELHMEKEKNTWLYELRSKHGNVRDFKQTLDWEDQVMAEAVRLIQQIPEIRLKFLHQKVQFSYTKKEDKQ